MFESEEEKKRLKDIVAEYSMCTTIINMHEETGEPINKDNVLKYAYSWGDLVRFSLETGKRIPDISSWAHKHIFETC